MFFFKIKKIFINFQLFTLIFAFEHKINFKSYKTHKEYKCAKIVGDPPNDPAIQLFYLINKKIIRYLSNSFLHERKLLI